jgi:hypothetical protein
MVLIYGPKSLRQNLSIRPHSLSNELSKEKRKDNRVISSENFLLKDVNTSLIP